MTGAITWDSLMYFVLIIGGLGTMWWRMETRISTGAQDALRRADEAHEKLNSFKLDVAENYAKAELIKDVERRLLSRLDAVVGELHGMRQDFQNIMIRLAASPTARKDM